MLHNYIQFVLHQNVELSRIQGYFLSYQEGRRGTSIDENPSKDENQRRRDKTNYNLFCIYCLAVVTLSFHDLHTQKSSEEWED
jgi:hypothetical protein